MMNYTTITDQIRKANAAAYAAYTAALISSRPRITWYEAVKSTVQLMDRRPLEICDRRIVYYIDMLGYEKEQQK